MKKIRIFIALALAVLVTISFSAFKSNHAAAKQTKGWFICNDIENPLDAESYTYDEFETESCDVANGELCRVYVTMVGADPDENELAHLSSISNGFTEPVYEDEVYNDQVRLKFGN